jgi:PAS domain S-box-containing protein
MSKQQLKLLKIGPNQEEIAGQVNLSAPEANQRFATTCQQAAIGIAHLNLDGKWLWANPKLCEIIGYTPDELYSMTYKDLTYPEDLEVNQVLEEQLIKREIPFYILEKRYVTKANKLIWVKITTSLITNTQDQTEYKIAFIEDITERKQLEERLQRLHLKLEEEVDQRTAELQKANQALTAQIADRMQTEAALREMTERLNLALGSARMGTWYWNNTDNKVIWDKHIEELFGLQPGTFKGTYDDFLACIHPDDRERVRAEAKATMSSDSEASSEYRVVLPDGSIRLIAARGKVFCDNQGKPIRTTGVCLDITEQKAIERSLQILKESYELALEAAQAGTWSRSFPAMETKWDDHIQRLFGYEPGTFPGTYEGFLNRIHPEDREHTIHKIENFTREKKVFELEYRVIWPDGSIHYIADRGKIYCDEQGQPIRLAGVCMDITERKKAEEWIKRRQQDLTNAARIHSLGEMASTLAHELNQPLAAIVNYTKGCIYRLQSGNYQIEQILQILEQAAQQSERAGDIIHRMKNFVQKGRLYFETIDLNQLVQAIVGFFDYEIQQHLVPIEFELADNLPPIEIDKMQIEQVLLNLIRNAVEAMQEAATEKPKIIIQSGRTENMVFAKVIDNGPGFPADITSKIWEPYFTTKKNGVGIGLSICRTIVEEHGGNLTVSANPEGGVCFEIGLPLLRKTSF